MAGLTKPHSSTLSNCEFMKFMRHPEHAQKSSSSHLYLVRKIEKALGTASLDTVKSKRRKGALAHQKEREQAAATKELCMEQQRWEEAGEAGRFGGAVCVCV